MFGAELFGAKLERAFLGGALLESADLTMAVLSGAILDSCFASAADFELADLRGASFRSAGLEGATFRLANLAKADFTEAHLSSTSFAHADLSGALFDGAYFGGTLLIGVDLRTLCVSRAPHHFVPSVVDHGSIARSLGAPGLRGFLVKTGMPELLADYTLDCLRSLDPEALFSMMRSTFLSYGGPDEPFAKRLHDSLEAHGVSVFFFHDDAPVGARLHRVMRQGVNEHDRIVLICSSRSLTRPGVENELQETLAREARDGGVEYLIPVTLDDFVFKGWTPSDPTIRQSVQDRVIADFRNHESDTSIYEAQVARLLAALRKRPVVPPSLNK